MALDAHPLFLVLLGVTWLGVALALRRPEGRMVTFPQVVLLLGVVAFALPLGLPAVDVVEESGATLYLTELGVILSLMGVGLKIDRPVGPGGWANAWRLLAIGMPLTVLGIAALGVLVLDLPLALAVLLGAVLAPTDPVLASDVQVGEPLDDPGEEGHEDEAEDELRFTLTSEAGLNDALAFPVTWLAVRLLADDGGFDPFTWLAVDVVYRIAAGLVVGLLGGKLLGTWLLRLPSDSERDRTLTGVGALAATLLLYGVAELLAGYGFLAVVVGALAIRHVERTDRIHRSLHVMAEQAEQLLLAGILLLLGGALADGLWRLVDLRVLLFVAGAILVVRPLAGRLALVRARRLDAYDRWLAAFFGIRGIGSAFYLAWAVEEVEVPQADLLWAVVLATVVTSVLVHGASTAPLLARRDPRQVEA